MEEEFGTFDSVVGDNAQAANSIDMEILELERQAGWISEEDTAKKQAELLLEQAQKSSQADMTLGQKAAGTAKFVGSAVKGMATGIAETVTEGIPAMAKNPKQALAGGLDVVSNVGNAGLEAFNAFQGWVNGDGLHWKHLQENERVDLGSYIAEKPLTEEEQRARSTADFLGKFAAFVGASLATGGAATLAGGGAIAATGAASVGGAAAGFLAFDPNEEGMAELAQKDPAVRNWLIDWFAGDENDSAFEGRMKNALGAVMGDVALGTAFFGVAKLAKLRRGMKANLAGPMGEVAETAVKQADALPETQLLDESALAKAEVQNADEAAQAAVAADAPETPKQGGGPTFGKRFEQTAKNLTPDQVRFGPLSGDEFLRLSKAANLEERGILAGDDPRAIVKFDTIEALEKLRGKPLDTDDLVTGALKILKDPDEVTRLQKFRKGGQPPNRFQAKALVIMEELSSSKILEAAEESRALIGTGNRAAVELADAKLAQAISDYQYWGGFREGAGSELGAGLQAMKSLGAEQGASTVKSLMLSEDMRKLTLGDKDQAARLRDTIINAIDESKANPEVKATGLLDSAAIPGWLKKGLQKTGNVLNNVVAANIQMMLSGVKTMLVNPMSGSFQIAFKNLEKRTAALLPKTEFKINTKNFERYFPGVKFSQLDDAGKELVNAQIKEIENFHNISKAAPDVEKYFDSMNDLQAFTDGAKDSLRLKWLASDAKFIPNSSTKFNNIVRTIKEADIEKMSFMDRIKYLGAQFKNQPSQPVTTFMSMQDAMVGNVQSVLEHRALARKFAKANAINAKHAEVLYKQMIEAPPSWMENMVTKSMEEVNFAQAFDPNVSKVFGNLEKALNNIPFSRAIVPFVRVNMNALDQAIQHTPAALLSGRFRAAMAEGGYARQIAMARVINGGAVGAIGAGLTLTGVVVGAGPRNPVARRAWEQANPGIKPYSIKNPLGGYISLNAFQGIGNVFKFSAEVAEIAAYVPEAKVSEFENIVLTGIAAVGDFFDPNFLTDETAKLTDFLENPTSKQAKKYIATKLVPGVGLGRSIVRGDIPFVEGTDTSKRNIDADPDNPTWDVFEMMWNNFKTTIPYWSDDLPAQRNLFGEPVTHYNMPGLGPENTSPLYSSSDNPKNRAVEQEIFRLGMSGPIFNPEAPEGQKHLIINPLPKYLTYEGIKVDLNPQQYEAFQRLAAGDYTVLSDKKLIDVAQAKQMSEDNLRNALDQIVKSDEYKEAADPIKRAMIKEQIQLRRGIAREYMIEIFPDIQFKQQLGTLDKMKAETTDVGEQETIEQEKQMLIRSRGSEVPVL